tara:strand:+ start:951 stop:1151 length:201 start_codon:yes stop_codon:yes gene_type:complete
MLGRGRYKIIYPTKAYNIRTSPVAEARCSCGGGKQWPCQHMKDLDTLKKIHRATRNATPSDQELPI